MPSAVTRGINSSRLTFARAAVKSPSFISQPSNLELLQIGRADGRAFQRRTIPLILFDVIVFEPPYTGGFKNTFPVNDAVSDFGERIAFEMSGRRLIAGLETFDMQERKPARIFVHIFHRIFAGECHPKAI